MDERIAVPHELLELFMERGDGRIAVFFAAALRVADGTVQVAPVGDLQQNTAGLPQVMGAQAAGVRAVGRGRAGERRETAPLLKRGGVSPPDDGGEMAVLRALFFEKTVRNRFERSRPAAV